MKRFLGSKFDYLLIILAFSTVVVLSNQNVFPQKHELQTEVLHLKTNQFNFTDLNFFDVSEFNNTSHWINVSRKIVANPYGYTTTRTEIHLVNNGTKSINALNYTIPNSEFRDTKYIGIYSKNDTVDERTEWEAFTGNETTLITVKFPTVEKKQNIVIVIEMDHPNAITFDDNDVLDADTFPYKFNLSFIPLINMPITNYEIEWKVGTEVEVSFENSSFRPTEDNFTGTMNVNSYGLSFKDIVHFSTINRTLLNSTTYGYTLNSNLNRSFIPAYTPDLAKNLTLFLSFNYYQFSGTKIEFTYLKTTIEMSEWGYIYYKHEILVKNSGLKSGPVLSTNLGGPTFEKLTFYLPEQAEKIGLRDNYGNLTPSKVLDPVLKKNSIQVKPRIEIKQGEEYHLFLSYRESVSDLVKDRGGGRVRLTTPLSMNFNWTIQYFELKVFVPHGSTFSIEKTVERIENSSKRETILNSSVQKRGLGLGFSLFNKPGVKVAFNDLTPLSNRVINFDFGMDPFVFIKEPLSIMSIFFILGLVYAMARNLSFGFKPKRITIDEIPIDLIREFVKSYEEKTALREQLLRLDRKRKSKNISAREYEQTRIILMNRQQRIDRALVNVSRRLADEGSRYRIAMRSIEVAEANREDILLNIESLEKKKTQGRIGKEAYAKLKLNYDKQLRKANNEVDKVLIELRSLLTR